MGCGSVTHICTFLDFYKYLKNAKNSLEHLFLRVMRRPIRQNDRLDQENKKSLYDVAQNILITPLISLITLKWLKNDVRLDARDSKMRALTV